jgi:hypothetical protein
MRGKQAADIFVFAPWNLRARQESGYAGARAAPLASREFIEQSSALTPRVPLLCHYSTRTQTYRDGARVAELRIEVTTATHGEL